jgi:all-trans-retinol 13,14-reductase
MNDFDVIIIGSGLGGLLCGYILSKEGKNVCILEKNRQPGGCLQSFSRNGVAFDTGVHYIGSLDDGQVLNRYFRYFGLNDMGKFRKLDENGFDIIAFDDAEYPMAMGFENFREHLLPFFPSKKNALQNYIDALQKISKSFPLYDLEVPVNHEEDTYYNLGMDELFTAGHSLSDVLAGNNFLYTGHPGSTPLHIAALINHSFISSAWRPVDGSHHISDRLTDQVRQSGGKILVGKDVSGIEKKYNNFRVRTKDGEQFSARSLVSAIHPAVTLAMTDSSMVRKIYSDRIIKLKNSPGCFTLFIVLKEDAFPQMNYNYYYHNRKNVWTGIPDDTWPGNYMLYTPSFSRNYKNAKSMVIMTVMGFDEVRMWEMTSTGRRGQDYLDFKEKKTELLLALVEKKFPGLRTAIKSIDSSTPLTWRDFTGTPEGSMYGIQRDFNNPLKTTILAKTKIPGFYFTGQNTNLHGVLGVTIGSVITCGEILGLDYIIKKIRNA